MDATIAKDYLDWKGIRSTLASNTPGYRPANNHLNPCQPPGIPSWVIHCDGSFINDSHEATYGVLLSNNHRQVWDGVSGTLFCSSPIVVEARAILEAIILASPLEAPTTIFSDFKNIIDIVNCPSHPWSWECYAIVGAILHMLQGKLWIRVSFILRSLNKVADWVAVSARQGSMIGFLSLISLDCSFAMIPVTVEW
ncbi:hypothetical protein LINPERHAP1_LOCUS16774 [Linum perenne]